MSSAGQFGSNNPFRRKQNAAAVNPAASSGSDLGFGIDGPPGPSTTSSRAPHTTFGSAAPENERRDEKEQPVQQKPKKIVKKVRVQSPPPSSPEDAVPVTRFPAVEQLDDDDDDDSASRSSKSDDQAEDPFGAGAADADSKLTSEPPLPQIPPNPFARTLQDIERRGPAHDVNATDAAAASASKGSLDVDSFKRLLLTGYANLPTPGQAATDSTGNSSRVAPSQGALPDGASGTDASSVSKQSIFDALHETPRTSHEISESEASEERKGVLPSSPLVAGRSAPGRKKPPPPSSRHGKLIRIDLGADSNSPDAQSTTLRTPGVTSPSEGTLRKASSGSDVPLRSPQGTTNINKPLPEPPVRASVDEDVDSPFDREAAGKVPEAFAELQAYPRPPTPPPTTRTRSESQTSTQSRKPAAPPPRRHGRSDSKIASHYHTHSEEDPPRSSMESNRSKAESFRVGSNPEKPSYAPAPPPPRRPGHARQDSSFAMNTHSAFSPAASPAISEKDRTPWGSDSTPLASPGLRPESSHGLSATTAGLNGQMKLSPPPPPPTRKQSTRRPASIRSVDSGNGPTPLRKVSREKDSGAPPPPPPRARGGRPTTDTSTLDEDAERKGSISSLSPGNEAVPPIVIESGNGNEILADLNALQREVDELMKKGTS